LQKVTDTDVLTVNAKSILHICMCMLIGSDLLRLCREDLIQICGTADGIRLYNALQAKYDFISQNVKIPERQLK